jgi:uncharacterized protein (DUF58 family)
MSVKKIKQISLWLIKLANNDFCPDLNKYVYWLKKPIGWVCLAFVFSLLVGILVGPQGFVLAVAAASLLVVGLVWPWVSAKGLACRLELPQHQIIENESFNVVFKVQNSWPFPIFGLMIKGNFLQDTGEDDSQMAFSLRWVPGWADTEFCIPLVASRRGVLPDGEIIVSNGFPFGLYEFSKPIAVSKPVVVWPANDALADSIKTTGTFQSTHGTLCDRPGNVGDSIGVRSYQQGDRLKNIHWAQSARSQRLMVRERQSVASAKATVVLDLSPEVHSGECSKSSFEQSIRVAASICWELHKNLADVRLVVIGLSPNLVRPTSNDSGIESIMESLACLPSLPEVKMRQAAGQSLGNVWHSGDLTFFVGTSKSSRFKDFPVGTETFLIDLSSEGSAQLLYRKTDLSPPKNDSQSPPLPATNDGESPLDGSYSYAGI